MLCLLVAAPLAITLIVLGAAVGYAVTIRATEKFGFKSNYAILPYLPLIVIASARQEVQRVVRTESTTVIISAALDKIWPMLLNMPRVEGPNGWMFSAGVASPISIRSLGRGRQCVLTTSVMAERITASESGRRLNFQMLNTPPTMKELNPFGEVQSQHLLGCCNCEAGEFLLTPLPGNRTKIVGQDSWPR
jgi:hypothetical protein